ncbi:MAG: pyridoxal phosphate-dependent aminotransferase [Bacteroidia bacterium]|jgi:aspartate/methionine/tyrosine aminotransferase
MKQAEQDFLNHYSYNGRWAEVSSGVIPLTSADIDFTIAPEIGEAICKHVKNGWLGYGPKSGLPALRESIAQVYSERYQVPTHPEQVLVFNSAASAIQHTVNHLMNKGEEAIIADPMDYLFSTSIKNRGGKITHFHIPLPGIPIDFEAFEKSIGPKTKFFALCNPMNPTGRVFSKEELLNFGTICLKHKIAILNDEIWNEIIYPGNIYVSLPSISEELRNITYTINGFSKTFGIAGLRVGYVIAPSDISCYELFKSSQFESTIEGVSILSQIGALAAYQQAWYWVDEFRAYLTQNMEQTVEILSTCGALEVVKPQGTYVVFPKITIPGWHGKRMQDYLLNTAKVAVVPGGICWFGPESKDYFRISLASETNKLSSSVYKIVNSINEIH